MPEGLETVGRTDGFAGNDQGTQWVLQIWLDCVCDQRAVSGERSGTSLQTVPAVSAMSSLSHPTSRSTGTFKIAKTTFNGAGFLPIGIERPGAPRICNTIQYNNITPAMLCNANRNNASSVADHYLRKTALKPLVQMLLELSSQCSAVSPLSFSNRPVKMSASDEVINLERVKSLWPMYITAKRIKLM